MPGEFDLIRWIRTQQTTSPRVPLAAGDDLAALRLGDDTILVGIDQVLDGVHFMAAEHDPELIGRKAMNRNLSDCAAMACLPAAAVVSLALSRGQSMEWTKRLYAGMRAAGEAFDCPIVGGDTGSWPGPLAITVAILGKAAGIEPIRRSGAKVGDSVYVTGQLGGSILGRHLDFRPRVHEARQLVANHRITAMIDLSDGLSRDVAHIAAESGVGIVIHAAQVPIHPDVARLTDSKSPLDHALHDGEDYELCFTGEPGIPGAICIGQVVAGQGVWIETDGKREALKTSGFEHRLG